MSYVVHSLIKKWGKRLSLLLSICALLGTHTVFAITQAQKNVFSEGIYYFNTEADSCDANDGSSSLAAAAGMDTPKWQTTLQPPYSLEDFVVEVLRDIAVKEGVEESSTVTQEHVLALVAFADGEGGNLTNNDIYNPWNTGYTGPDLQPVGGHASNGVQSYGSFNDGVEATARVMTGTGGSAGYQSRLGIVLKDPTTTAQGFMKTLTYFQRYTNNKAWAGASDPTDPTPDQQGNTGTAKQNAYYQGRLQLLQSTQANYKSIASLVIGPPGDSADKNLHSPHSLRYSFSTDTSSNPGNNTASGVGCNGDVGAVQGSIVQTAINFAWDDVAHPQPTQDTPVSHGFQELNISSPNSYTKQNYQDAVAKYEAGVDSTGFTDCGVFVATVMRASGVDPNYTASGTPNQLAYVRQHPEKYKVMDGITDTSAIQVGDIFINGEHTWIYVGKDGHSDGWSVAEASQFNHSPEIDANPLPAGFTLVRVIK